MSEVLPLGKLAEALSKAQQEIKPPAKKNKVDFTDKNGRRVHYSYADLADCIEVVREPLAKNGLALFHKMGFCETVYGMRTVLMHSSGESIDTWYPLPDPHKTGIKPQEFGSALTYARRYSLSCLVGIASEEDDDGANGAATTPLKQNNQPKAQTQPPKQNQTIPSPGNYVMPFGEGTKGLALRNIPIETLMTVLKYIDGELEKDTVGADTKKNFVGVKNAILKFIGPVNPPPTEPKADPVLKQNDLATKENSGPSNEVEKKEPVTKPKKPEVKGLSTFPKKPSFDDFVIPFDVGDIEVKGKMLKDLPEKTLRNVIIQLGHQMSLPPGEAQSPDGVDLKTLFNIRSNISTFLVSMGVKP